MQVHRRGAEVAEKKFEICFLRDLCASAVNKDLI